MADQLTALLRMAEGDPVLRSELAAATTAEEVAEIARGRGVTILVEDVGVDLELTDAELDAVSGGTILHPTMSVFCGTNGSFCTFNPYACQSPG